MVYMQTSSAELALPFNHLIKKPCSAMRKIKRIYKLYYSSLQHAILELIKIILSSCISACFCSTSKSTGVSPRENLKDRAYTYIFIYKGPIQLKFRVTSNDFLVQLR